MTTFGWLCVAAYTMPAAAAAPLHGFLIELGISCIAAEVIFSGLVVNRVVPSLSHKMTKDFIVHHAASLVAGFACLYFHRTLPGMGLGRLGSGLCATEITTFLPVSFRASVRSKRITRDAKVSTVIGLLFPIAFMWRSYWSARVCLEIARTGRAYMAAGAAPWGGLALAERVAFHCGEAAVAVIAGCNVNWTLRIVQGTLKVVRHKQTKAKGGAGEAGAAAGPRKGRRRRLWRLWRRRAKGDASQDKELNFDKEIQ